MKLSETYNECCTNRPDWSVECEKIEDVETEFKIRKLRWIELTDSGVVVIPEIGKRGGGFRISWDFGDFERAIEGAGLEAVRKAEEEVEKYREE